MDPEKIIEQLKDENIKLVVGITIRLNLSGIDYINIHYFDKKGQLKEKTKYIKSGGKLI
jgi:hypothetical protein